MYMYIYIYIYICSDHYTYIYIYMLLEKPQTTPLLTRISILTGQVNVNLGQLQFRQHNVTAVPKEACRYCMRNCVCSANEQGMIIQQNPDHPANCLIYPVDIG